ncbi:hypothetical protein Tco_0456793, partial [Tanacetum coccineum]
MLWKYDRRQESQDLRRKNDRRQWKLSDFKEFKGGYVAFGNDSKGGRISGKRTIKPTSTPIEAHKSLGKDVDVHLY